MAVASTLWPEIESLEISCFLVGVSKGHVLGRECPSLGNFFFLIEVKDTQTCVFLVLRSLCLLITLSLDPSIMGLRLVTGKYQEKVLRLFRLITKLSSFPVEEEWS